MHVNFARVGKRLNRLLIDLRGITEMLRRDLSHVLVLLKNTKKSVGEPADIGRPALRQTYLVSYASINSIRFNGTRINRSQLFKEHPDKKQPAVYAPSSRYCKLTRANTKLYTVLNNARARLTACMISRSLNVISLCKT